MEQLRYPAGRFERQTKPRSRAAIDASIDTIEQAPARYRALVQRRSDSQLDARYRPEGWTVRQVVHHVADSHMNAYVRMKFAVTEDAPTIKPYDEARWAELPDARTGPADMSLALVEALHRRWVMFLRGLADADFSKVYVHPEMGRVTLDEAVAMYAWHCRHHEGHIKQGLGIRE
jgi:hypothetical protein